MKARHFLFLVACGLFGFLLASQADEVKTNLPAPGKIRDDATLQEQILAKQFAQFEQDLFKLILKLKRSTKPGDKEQAEVLEKVLDTAKSNLVAVQFDQIVNQLKEQQVKSTGEIRKAAEASAKLADDLRRLIALMKEDPGRSRLKKDIEDIKAILKDLEQQIHNQKVTQGITDANKTDKNELGKIQEKNSNDVKKLIDKIGNLQGGKGGEPKDSKGDPKGDGKSGDQAGKGKDVGKGADKGGQKDPGKKDPQVAKGDPKGAGDPKKGDPKAGEPKAGDPKQAGAKPGDPKSGDPKSGSGKPSQGEPKEGGDPKQGKGKPGEKSDGQGESKPGGDQGEQKPDAGPQKPQPPQGPKDNIANSKKKIEVGNYQQKKAEDNIAKEKNPDASKDQDEAVKNFEDAKKKLEDLLRQLREEELERTLADLLRRCEKMLAMQVSVFNGTKGVFAEFGAKPLDDKAKRESQIASLKLSDNEGEIVVEARKAIEVLEAEGSAVAFPEVFHQVKEDMIHVQRRLGIGDTGMVTQNIEQDIIDSLKEMIEALKKAKEELDKKKSNPPPPGQSPPPQDQKLLELIQELKLIRSLQIRVNTRTTTYGRMYQAKEGEQTADPGIRRELHNLSERQERIFDITNRLAKGDNK